MSDFKLKKTRMIVVASIFWILVSFYLGDTGYSKDSFDFDNIKWETFFVFSLPVPIYWAYYWINKGR
mgnify:CR=1 FL=1